MKALQLFVLLKKVVAPRTCLHCKNPRICNYSTLASAQSQRWSFFSEDSEEESSVYKHALMFKRPSTIKYKGELRNSVSLIGIVERPLRKVNSSDGSHGVHTILALKKSSHSSLYPRVLLSMWDETAELSINHLKLNDFIYVWGHLASYEKADNDGNPRLCHKVNVKEINYVAQNADVPTQQQIKTLDSRGTGEHYLERDRKRLLLWQVYFASPYEWNDYRKTKNSPKHPDFKHKSTGEALWLRHDDPPWINRQLQFLDSVILGRNQEGYMSSKLCSFLPENHSE